MCRNLNKITPDKKRSPLVDLWGVCVALGLWSCSSAEESAIAPPQPETPEAPVQNASGTQKNYSLGEAFAIQDEDTDVVINFSGSRTHQGEEFLKPKENHYWYYLTATVVNRSADEFVISPDFYTLKDSQKNTYQPSFRAHAIRDFRVMQGRIAPTSEKTAEIGFELPDGTRPTTLSFDISNYTACNDKILKPTYFCKPILIDVSEQRG